MSAATLPDKERLAHSAALAQLLLHVAELEHAHALAWEVFDREPTALATFTSTSMVPQATNAAWRSLFGQDAASRRGGGVGAEASALIARVLRDGTPAELETVELASASGPRYVSLLVVPQRDAQAAVVGAIASCVETTDETLARRLGLPRHARVWSGDPVAHTSRCGRSWCELTGGGPETPWIDAVHPDDRERCLAAWAAAERDPRELRARLRRCDGVHRWHALRIVLAPGTSCAIGGALELGTDVESAFLATVSHELRAPLTTMMLWIGVLTDEAADPELRREAIAAIRQSAQQQSRLVGDLVDIARASTGKLSIQLRSLDLRQLIEEALDAIVPSFAAKQVAVETRYHASSHAVDGDASRMRQVIDNLLSNALKFTDAGGQVVISTALVEHSLVVSIADTGCGMPPEFLRRLFVPFAQQEGLSARTEGGLGLGLAIAREIVVLHHGKLEAASDGIGRGSTFTLTLRSAGRERALTPPPLRTPGSLAGLRVLVVDDDHRVRSALGVLLARAGGTVRAAASVAQALELLRTETFDAMISDIVMPGADGYQLVRELRAAGQRIPAIALSGHVAPEHVRMGREAGFDLHLAKPVDMDRLIAGIHAAIARRAGS